VRIRRRAPVQQGGLAGGPERITRDRKGDKTMPTGTVKWFNATKGYGFIGPEAGGKDIFVHHSVIEGSGFKTLQENETVEYEFEDGPKGAKATKVRRVEAVSPAT